MQQAIVDKSSLLKELTKNSLKIRSYGVVSLGLFGSFRHDCARPESDVDLLVDFDKGKKTYDNFMDLSFYLEELLGREVELVTSYSLSKFIGPHILNQVEHVHI